jgi:3-hydroxybutyryl-CoA dehydrogenase
MNMTINQVAVLGFGTMGAGIVEVVARAGHTVVVLETDASRIAGGFERLDASVARAVTRGKVSAEDAVALRARITAVTSVAELAGSELVIEAVTENRDAKVALLADVAAAVGPDAIVVTNTSALSVTDIASTLPGPGRVAGLHFFNPAPVMELVEVVRALQTDDAVFATVHEFAVGLGKAAIEVKDRPGFLLNHLLMPYLNDVVVEYDAGLASAEDMDVALQLGLGYPLGALAMLDLIGLDNHLHATESAYEATQDPGFAPPPLLRAMVAAGYHGTKSGRGFRVGQT